MKGVFLVHITLPDYFDKHFYDLIPKQRFLVNSLMEQGIVLSYSLDMDRKNVWMFFASENEEKVMDVLSTFPIIKEVKVSIQEMAFLESAPHSLPDLILN